MGIQRLQTVVTEGICEVPTCGMAESSSVGQAVCTRGSGHDMTIGQSGGIR